MEKSNNAEKMIGALLLGAAIGGILGILFAPDKGSETRKKISKKSNDITGAVKEKLKTLFEEVQKEAEIAKVQADEFIGNGAGKNRKFN